MFQAMRPTFLLSMLFWLFALSAKAGAAPVGEVIFISGEAQAVREEQSRPMAVGAAVYVGERLITADEGHVHVRFVDGGLVSVRPGSAVRIEDYRFDPDEPRAGRVQLVLEYGALRSATGKIGQQHKEGFRLNTPVSAIGIRGTDFVVYADDSLARLMVHSGGVVMAPLGEGCMPTGYSGCDRGAAELFASLSPSLLEVRSGVEYTLVTTEVPTPDDLRPPHPEEAGLFARSEAAARTTMRARSGLSAEGATSYEDGLERVGRYLDEQSPASLVDQAYLLAERGNGVIQPRDRGLVEDPHFVWGRWSAPRLNTTAYRENMNALVQDRRYLLLNSVFALLEYPHEQRPLPEAGRVSFELNSYEAYVQRGARLEEAGISNAALVVDFEQGGFATRLDLHAESLPGVVQIVGAGELTREGFFYSDASSPARIDGVLSPHAEEAGMLFEYQISPGVDAVGATHWLNLDRR